MKAPRGVWKTSPRKGLFLFLLASGPLPLPGTLALLPSPFTHPCPRPLQVAYPPPFPRA